MDTGRTTSGKRCRWKLVGSRLALVLLGIVAGLLATEVLLQIGAAYLGTTTGKAPVAFRTQRLRVLALGDSNTYGFFVGSAAAYPRKFEALWNERQPRKQSVEVLNLGFPGTNSSQVLREFDRMLFAFRPDVVTLMIGANDAWTMPVGHQEQASTFDLREFLWRNSRVFRLFYMLLRAYENASLEVQMDPQSQVFAGKGQARFGSFTFALGHRATGGPPVPDWAERLERNLKEVTRKAREAGVAVVLLTYPSSQHLYGYANVVLRRVASETDATLIDVAAQFPAECAAGPCAELLPDQHPSEQGHERVARILVGEFERLLQ